MFLPNPDIIDDNCGLGECVTHEKARENDRTGYDIVLLQENCHLEDIVKLEELQAVVPRLKVFI